MYSYGGVWWSPRARLFVSGPLPVSLNVTRYAILIGTVMYTSEYIPGIYM